MIVTSRRGRAWLLRRTWWRALVVAALATQLARATDPPPDPSDSRAVARTHGYAGLEAYRVGDYVTARRRLGEAFALARVPSIGLWLARTDVQLGNLVEAATLYEQVASLPIQAGEAGVQAAARRTAVEEGFDLSAQLPQISFHSSHAAGGSVWLDGARIDPRASRHLDPGSHSLSLKLHGSKAEVSFQIARGERLEAWLGTSLLPNGAAAPALEVRKPKSPPAESASAHRSPASGLVEADPPQARVDAEAGLEAYQRGNYEAAHRLLESAFAATPLPVYAAFAARASAARGHLLDAASLYAAAATAKGAGKAQEVARREASREGRALRRRIPRLRVLLVDALRADLVVTLNGMPMDSMSVGDEWLVDPGTHEVEGRRGREVVTVLLTLGEGERRDAILQFRRK